MTNFAIQLKIKERINKLASYDNDNLECWQIVEAFNKAQLDFVRRLVYKGEESKETLEDLQILIKETVLKGSNQTNYFESTKLPQDFLASNRVDILAQKGDCTKSDFKTYLVENANISLYLTDALAKPSFEWRETLTTIQGNTLRVYTNGEFDIKKVTLSYYRNPQPITIAGCADISQEGLETLKDTPCEFKDTLIEKLIDETAAILAADIESWNQVQRNLQNSRT